MKNTLLNDFKSPGAEYRGAPFWAWNGKLDPAELRRQIQVMQQMGLGGFFMHSRIGLATSYLSPEWFSCIDACVDEAKKLGMDAWLYDEDRWPSGAAGGLVTKDQKYRMRSLVPKISEKASDLKWTSDTVAAFTAKIDGTSASQVRRLPKGKAAPKLAAGEKLIVFVIELQGCSNWYNGFTYLDTLSHEAVKAFIKVTHEAYKKHNGKEFGKTIPGMFTDEPNHGNKLGHDNNTGNPGGLPWTGSLLKTFQKRYGYDLVPHLVELVFDVDGTGMHPARLNYHDCVTHLYVDAFGRQIFEWCQKNNLKFTGHQLEEDTLSSQTNMVGSCIRNYEFMQAPGMDLLTEHWRVFNTAKQVTSGARQFGAKWRLTETYGCTGWDFPFAGHKALGDWQVAMGINLRCQHLAWYTMEGEAKRDYPAGIFYQSPWWQLYPKVEDYFARIHAVMTRGEEVRDLLVVHPVESMWMQVKIGWRGNPETHAMDTLHSKLTENLLAQHLDFDFGDEEHLGRLGKVAKQGGTPILRLGKATYKAVLVPQLKTMRRSTLALLKKFKTAGGTVVFAGTPAGYVDALKSEDVAQLATSCPQVPATGAEVAAPLEKSCRRVSISDAAGNEIGVALYLLREDRDSFFLFVCNTSEDFVNAPGHSMNQPLVRDRKLAFADVRIRGFAGCTGTPVELNPETGATSASEFSRNGNGFEIRTSLPALGSRMFLIPKVTQTSIPAVSTPTLKTLRTDKLGGEAWDITLSECANLVLDRPRYRIGKGDWQNADEILRIDRAVRSSLGIQHRSGNMVQPWAQPHKPNPKRTPVSLTYTFDCQALPSGDLFVALEQPQTFRVSLNGVPVNQTAESGWWVDLSLRKLPLDTALLRLGKNELTLECDYEETHPGLEIVYLLGNFGTAVNGTDVAITALPTKLQLGDWVPQGLTFYSGSVSYRRSIDLKAAPGQRLFIRVQEYRGVAVRVLVNGKEAGIAAWEPNEVEVTGLAEGLADVQIQLIGHRRNSHGPFHLKEKWPQWTGPGEFTRGPDSWFDGYQLVPCGLMAEPELIVRG
ncbi:MAG: glycosyl hydrolase [bacterium]